jgi:hypothetical protein
MRPDTLLCGEASKQYNIQCPEDMATPYECQSEFEEELDFHYRHELGRQLTSVRTSGQHHPNAVLNMAIRGESLYLSE